MSNNNFKVLYYDQQGIELDTFLRQSGDKLRNTRIFYLLSAKMDNHEVYKLGISERGDNSAFGRLKDYVHFYSVTNSSNPCHGVKLYVCLANTFNVDVNNPDSAVRKFETSMKRDFKSAMVAGRGTERIHNTPLSDIFQYLDERGVKEQLDTERPTRQTPRLQEASIGSNDAVESILSHTINRRNGLIFEVRFKRSRVYDSNQNSRLTRMPDRKMTYDQLILVRNGKQKADEYLANNITV